MESEGEFAKDIVIKPKNTYFISGQASDVVIMRSFEYLKLCV